MTSNSRSPVPSPECWGYKRAQQDCLFFPDSPVMTDKPTSAVSHVFSLLRFDPLRVWIFILFYSLFSLIDYAFQLLVFTVIILIIRLSLMKSTVHSLTSLGMGGWVMDKIFIMLCPISFSNINLKCFGKTLLLSLVLVTVIFYGI